MSTCYFAPCYDLLKTNTLAPARVRKKTLALEVVYRDC